MKSTVRLILVLLFVAGILVSCDPFHAVLTEKDVSYYQAATLKPAAPEDTLKVMTWNIKFGGGRIDFFFDCWGDRVIMTEQEVLTNMDSLASFIRFADPDILMCQEADMDSKRSAFVNQVQYLLDHTDMNYAVYASQWRADYVPSDGIGKINSGNVILSKWPLKDAVRIGLPLMDQQNSIVRYFYLRRNILKTTTTIGDKEIDLLCSHLSAYDYEQLRVKQLKILTDTLHAIVSRGDNFIFGADLNVLPPGTRQVKGFEDSVCEDNDFTGDSYEGEENWMLPIFEFQSEFDLEDYKKDNTLYFSHTVNNEERGSFWNRKLDYLFSSGGFIPGTNITHQDSRTGRKTMHLSDHCPVSVLYVLP